MVIDLAYFWLKLSARPWIRISTTSGETVVFEQSATATRCILRLVSPTCPVFRGSHFTMPHLCPPCPSCRLTTPWSKHRAAEHAVAVLHVSARQAWHRSSMGASSKQGLLETCSQQTRDAACDRPSRQPIMRGRAHSQWRVHTHVAGGQPRRWVLPACLPAISVAGALFLLHLAQVEATAMSLPGLWPASVVLFESCLVMN